jgi:hypothetical protein
MAKAKRNSGNEMKITKIWRKENEENSEEMKI